LWGVGKRGKSGGETSHGDKKNVQQKKKFRGGPQVGTKTGELVLGGAEGDKRRKNGADKKKPPIRKDVGRRIDTKVTKPHVRNDTKYNTHNKIPKGWCRKNGTISCGKKKRKKRRLERGGASEKDSNKRANSSAIKAGGGRGVEPEEKDVP